VGGPNAWMSWSKGTEMRGRDEMDGGPKGENAGCSRVNYFLPRT